jgi:hypothetical protein
MAEEEKEVIELGKDDAALIINDDGIQLVLPKMESDDLVPEYYLYVSALAYLTTDRDFVDEVLKRFEEIMNKFREENKE